MSKRTKRGGRGKASEHRRQRKAARAERRRRGELKRAYRRQLRTRYAVEFRRAIARLIGEGGEPDFPVHGNAAWQIRPVAVQILYWAICEKKNLTDAFDWSRWKCQQVLGEAAFGSYNGMLNALVRYRTEIQRWIVGRIRERLPEVQPDDFRHGRWAVFAIDGSRGSAPRTRDNEQAFQSPTYGRGQTAKYRRKKTKGMRRRNNRGKPPAPPRPQVWMTVVDHLRSNIPWGWKLGPGNASERQHGREMFAELSFPDDTLFVGDAGFVGYEFWRSILQAGHQFVVRVGGNINLIEGLEPSEVLADGSRLVHCWPATAGVKHPPLKLRLIEIQLGDKRAALLTGVSDPSALSVGEAKVIYEDRWSIELGYRDLKQTFGKRELRSRTPARVLAELDAALMAVAVMRTGRSIRGVRRSPRPRATGRRRRVGSASVVCCGRSVTPWSGSMTPPSSGSRSTPCYGDRRSTRINAKAASRVGIATRSKTFPAAAFQAFDRRPRRTESGCRIID